MERRTRRGLVPWWALLVGASFMVLAGCTSNPTSSATPQPPSTASPTSPPTSPPASTSMHTSMPTAASRTQALIDYLLVRVRDDPTDPDAQLELGLALMQRIRETADPSLYAPAGEALAAARRLLPRHPAPLVGLAGLLLGRHEFAEALENGRAALRLAPDSSAAGAVVVDALIELGRYDEAFDAAESLAARSPDLASLSRVSYARELRGDIDGALEAMRVAVASRGVAPENTAFAWSIVGHLERLAGDPIAARSAFETALGLVHDHPPSLAGMARLAAGEGDLVRAAAGFERAAAVLPLPEYVIALGEVHDVAGDARAARRLYDTARAEIALFQAAGVRVDLDLALFECDHGDPSMGLVLAQDAYTATPTVRAADALAWCLHRTGDHHAAAARAVEALRLGSRDPLFLYHAGVIGFVLGDTATARERLAAAIELDPGFSPIGAGEARRLLDRLAEN